MEYYTTKKLCNMIHELYYYVKFTKGLIKELYQC
jgi:hypothetical protein